MTQKNRHAMVAEPRAILHAVRQGVPIVPEMRWKLEPYLQRGHELGLAAYAVKIDETELQLGCGSRGLRGFRRAGPIVYAGIRHGSEVGKFHGRILVNDR